MIVVSVTCALVAMGSAATFRLLRRRPPKLPSSAPEETLPADPLAGWSVRVGDVVQRDRETRWPDGALLIRETADRLRFALLLAEEGGEEHALLAFPPPSRDLLWLTERDVGVVDPPPPRIEIEGLMLDRRASLPALVEAVGGRTAPPGEQARFAWYEGSIGDGAVVLAARDRVRLWYGARLRADDWDNLGSAPGDE